MKLTYVSLASSMSSSCWDYIFYCCVANISEFKKNILGCLRDSNAAAHFVDSQIVTYFTEWSIYNFMHDDLSMSRCDRGLWQKSTWWSELCLDIKRYTWTPPPPNPYHIAKTERCGNCRSRNRAEILYWYVLNFSVRNVAIDRRCWGRVHRNVRKC